MTDRGQGTREPQTFHGHPLGGNDAPREADLVPGDRLVERFDEWFWDGRAWTPGQARGTEAGSNRGSIG